jgi:deoxyribonuclease-4
MTVAPPKQTRPWGAHMSIAGGVDQAVVRGEAVGCAAIQLFTKNNNQWSGKPLTDDDVARFAAAVAERGVKPVAAHDGYLINLASPDPGNREKSRVAFLDEIDRADALGVPLLVFHPGAHMGEGESAGLAAVVAALDGLIEERPDSKVTLTVETTAGQGTSLGYRFDHIGAIVGGSKYPERFGVCVDTCHIFAAGYDIVTPDGWEATWKAFDAEIGLSRLKMFHVNDSKKDRGSRVDRHDHIGKGFIGLAGFRHLVNDPRFVDLPMILETPKGKECAEDVENLATLNGLIAAEKGRKRGK